MTRDVFGLDLDCWSSHKGDPLMSNYAGESRGRSAIRNDFVGHFRRYDVADSDVGFTHLGLNVKG